MSGLKTVSELVDILNKTAFNASEKVLLKGLYIMDSSESWNSDLIDMVRDVQDSKPNDLVYATEDGRLSFVKQSETVTKPSSSGMKNEVVVLEEEIPFSVKSIKEIIAGKFVALDSSKIRHALESYLNELPKTAETYKVGEVKILKFEGMETTIAGLLSAGTKVLDALLYVTYQNSLEHNFIFKVDQVTPKKVKKSEISMNVMIGNKAIKAAFCLVYNQGYLPTKTNDERNLSKFVKETIFRDKDLTSNKLCEYLSCTDPTFFPSSVFLDIDLTLLPSEVSSRCKMSIAGNKAIRYAMFAKKFEQATVEQPTDSTVNSMSEYMRETAKIEKAKAITELLSSLGSKFDAQKRMHPLSPARLIRKNFTLQLTCAIVTSLSKTGRESMRKMIEAKDIAAFKRDENIFGVSTVTRMISFPVLLNSDADFSELSVESVKMAYGVTD
jgi:hypothetical protein